MDINPSADHRAIEESVGRITARFGDDYWSACDSNARFPEEFHRAMAESKSLKRGDDETRRRRPPTAIHFGRLCHELVSTTCK